MFLIKELGIFMYKYKTSLLPTSFDHLFTNLESIHNYDIYTRNKTNYVFKFIKQNLFLPMAQWTSLPYETERHLV